MMPGCIWQGPRRRAHSNQETGKKTNKGIVYSSAGGVALQLELMPPLALKAQGREQLLDPEGEIVGPGPPRQQQ